LITIRLATLDDIPALPGIERSAGEAFAGTAQAWVGGDVVTEAEAYPPLIAARSVRVAEADCRLVGFVHTEMMDDELHVWELAVRRDRQGQGIGAALMDAARDEALAHGCKAMTLTTFRSIPFNAPFYRRLGYEILDAPDPRLAEILAVEAARGLTDRCAMRARL
jgi:GNAT superfamily N-acetyltransferase